MDYPALSDEEQEYIAAVVAEVRDIRNWRAEQRAKYGMDWEDNDPPGRSDYERSRGLIPADAK